MWEEGGIQWTNGPMVGHIIVRMGIPSMGGPSVLDCEYLLIVSPLLTICVLTFAHCSLFLLPNALSYWCNVVLVVVNETLILVVTETN